MPDLLRTIHKRFPFHFVWCRQLIAESPLFIGHYQAGRNIVIGSLPSPSSLAFEAQPEAKSMLL